MLGSIQHFLSWDLLNFFVQRGGLSDRRLLIERGLKREFTVVNIEI